MLFNFNKYSGLLLIFFVHGLTYAILLLRKGIKNDRDSDKWLSIFLILSILFICPWMLGYAGWYNGKVCMECRNFMFYMPFQHTLLMGPVIYFYVLSLLNPQFTFIRRYWIHLIPAFLYIIWNVIVVFTDRIILKKYFLMDGENDPDFQIWYIVAGILSLLYYLILSLRYYKSYRKFIVQELSFADSVSFQWVQNFLIACFIYFLSTLVFNMLDLFNLVGDTKGAWWYYLFFAFIFYYIAITGYSNSIESKAKFEVDFFKYPTTYLLSGIASQEEITEDIPFEEVSKISSDKKAGNEVFEVWKAKVFTCIVTQKRYNDPDLTLTDLAKELGTNSSLLSKVINQSFQLNFNDFVNYYRVMEVQNKLQNPSFSNVTIMSIAYEAGFNSKATFNRAFKKVTQKNPKDFIIN